LIGQDVVVSKKVPRSGHVTAKATGRLFENMEDDLDLVSTNINEKMISIQEEMGRQSSSSAGRKSQPKRPSSKTPVPDKQPPHRILPVNTTPLVN